MRLAFPLAAVLVAIAAMPAAAELESWNWVELRLPLADYDPGPATPWLIRFDVQDNGFHFGSGGQLLFRIGPIWEITPHWSLGANFSNTGVHIGPDTFQQETALEVEPSFRTDFGPVQFGYRNRLESRWLPSGHNWRDRNQVRFNYRVPDSKLVPFAWDELYYDLSGTGFNQNRATVGVGWQFDKTFRLDGGAMLRSLRAQSGAWSTDPVIQFSLVITPVMDALFFP